MNGYACPIHTERHLNPCSNGSYGIILPLLIANYRYPVGTVYRVQIKPAQPVTICDN